MRESYEQQLDLLAQLSQLGACPQWRVDLHLVLPSYLSKMACTAEKEVRESFAWVERVHRLQERDHPHIQETVRGAMGGLNLHTQEVLESAGQSIVRKIVVYT